MRRRRHGRGREPIGGSRSRRPLRSVSHRTAFRMARPTSPPRRAGDRLRARHRRRDDGATHARDAERADDRKHAGANVHASRTGASPEGASLPANTRTGRAWHNVVAYEPISQECVTANLLATRIQPANARALFQFQVFAVRRPLRPILVIGSRFGTTLPNFCVKVSLTRTARSRFHGDAAPILAVSRF